MKKLTSREVRNFYLDFFKSHEHAIIPSASIVPENDPTVLFTTAGMHPLVPYLLGENIQQEIVYVMFKNVLGLVILMMLEMLPI